MKTIVPTSCIVVAGQEIRQWRKLYRNKIRIFGKSWTEHVYEFTPVGLSWSEKDLRNYQKKDPYKIRVYKNDNGNVIWAVEVEPLCFFHNDLSPEINKCTLANQEGKWPLNNWQSTSWIGWKKEWKRSYSDTRFLLSFERTREDFIEKVTEHRTTWLLFPSSDVEISVVRAYEKAELGQQGRLRIGSYSGPASLSIEDLKALGCKVCHKPPTQKFPEVAPGDYVVENFNWGAKTPEHAEWFRYGAGYHYHGTVGCNAGWVWYEG